MQQLGADRIDTKRSPLADIFPGVAEDPSKLEVLYPMYSLWSVEMPSPGPDFITFAEERSGVAAPKGFAKMTGSRPSTPNTFLASLEELYRAALYYFPFQIKVAIKGQTPKAATFVPGGLWGDGSTGPVSARIMVIGKHPGWEEASTGKLFSGPTSQILVNALDDIGIDSDEYNSWYMTNLVKFPHLDPSKGTLPADWIKDCLPLLHQELRLVLPDYILCLGDDAIKGLLGKQATLGNTSGKVIEYKIPRHEFADETPVYHTAKVLTCMHPARVARQTDLEPQFKSTIAVFKNLINGESVYQEETDLIRYVFSDEQSLSNWVDQIISEKPNMFAVDCEWQGDYPTEPGAYLRTVQVSWGHKKAALIEVRNAVGVSFNGSWQTPLLKLLKRQSDRQFILAGHNFRADLPWLFHNGVDLRPEFEAPEDDPSADGSGPGKLFGWQKTATEGGFDTMLAVHAWQETHQMGLEACTSQLVGVPRYDHKFEEYKKAFCTAKGIKTSELEGYGEFADSELNEYALYDADASWRLADVLNKPGGLLDSDRFGNNCRKAFWISMKAAPAFLEMEMSGVMVDRQRAEALTTIYETAKDTQLRKFRNKIKWLDFNPSSSHHKVELLFGAKKIAKRPPGAITLDLTPIKATGKKSKSWQTLLAEDAKAVKIDGKPPGSVISQYSPSTDKETMGILGFTQLPPNHPDIWKYELVRDLRDINFIGHLLKSVLRPPRRTSTQVVIPADIGGEEIVEDFEDELDEAGNKIYDKGMLSYIHSDSRVRSHFFTTKETGRASSSKPPLQNLSKRRESDYKRILGKDWRYPLRSILCASPGTVLIEADYTAAEVAAMAWMSGDEALIEHARRSALPENHPDYYDVHSNIAVRAFQLDCPPTKDGLKSIGKLALRTGAKCIFFGFAYGQGPEAAARKAQEEGAHVTVGDAIKLMNSLVNMYPILVDYFNRAKARARNELWLCNCFGRYRRFGRTLDRKTLGDNERQAGNFGIQSTVSDAVSLALGNIYHYRDNHDIDYKIVLPIHDAVILEVPIKYTEVVYDTVIPECMTDRVDVWPTTFDGNRLPGYTEPYHLSTGRDVYLHWGTEIPMAAHEAFGIPKRFCSEHVPDDEVQELLKQPEWKTFATSKKD